MRDAKISIENRSVPELKENENEERKYLYAYDINGDGISDIFNLSFMRWDNAQSYPAIKIYLSSKKANSEEIQYQLKVKNYVLDNQLKVVKILSNTPAEKAGVEVGDYLLEINGSPLKTYGDYDILINYSSRQMRLKVKKSNGSVEDLNVTLAYD